MWLCYPMSHWVPRLQRPGIVSLQLCTQQSVQDFALSLDESCAKSHKSAHFINENAVFHSQTATSSSQGAVRAQTEESWDARCPNHDFVECTRKCARNWWHPLRRHSMCSRASIYGCAYNTSMRGCTWPFACLQSRLRSPIHTTS